MDNSYICYLSSIVESDKVSLHDYGYLFKDLLRTEFTWFDEKENDLYLDENRAGDGLYLRRDYCDSNGMSLSDLSKELDVGNKCSVLEMMVAFAKRIDDEIMWDNNYGDRTSLWFWYMLYSLRLIDCKDDYTYSQISVRRKLNKFLRRKYSADGYGGLFYLEVKDWQEVKNYFDYIPDFYPNMNDVELWQQMGIWTQLYSAGIIIKHLGD